jgi:predicted nucleic acid-binding protein
MPRQLFALPGRVRLLFELPGEVLFPKAVADEIAAGPDDLARQALLAKSFSSIEVQALPEILAWDLGSGETAVLSYALINQGWIAVIDDRAARKCARSFSIPYKGTLAIILQAKKMGIIDSAAEAVVSLKTAGLRLDDETIKVALKQITGEDWQV